MADPLRGTGSTNEPETPRPRPRSKASIPSMIDEPKRRFAPAAAGSSRKLLGVFLLPFLCPWFWLALSQQFAILLNCASFGMSCWLRSLYRHPILRLDRATKIYPSNGPAIPKTPSFGSSRHCSRSPVNASPFVHDPTRIDSPVCLPKRLPMSPW